MKHEKTIEEKYQKLDEISHVLQRPGRYIGSITPHTAPSHVLENDKFVKKEITYIPALLKVFDEVISNSVDFSKTQDGKHLDTIKVDINKKTGKISVHDNGGIAVVQHSTHNQWIPELIFELRAGSNFNDEDDSLATGQNGEGAALTAIFATEFEVLTADGVNQFKQTHLDNTRKKTEPKITESEKHFTHITWIPDYPRFNLTGLDEDNYQKLVKRVYDIAGCNPNLKIYFNNKLIKINSFKDYIKMFVDELAYDENDNWKIGISSANEGFEHQSFVNSTETFVGGTHIDYVTNQIVSKLKEYFKKKHKVDVKPSDIKNHLYLFINADIIRPRYSSQTKEQLITESKNYMTSWECSDKFIKKVLELNAIQNILDWVKAKEDAAAKAELRKGNKNINKADPKNIAKFHDATSKNRTECLLFIVEGDSALSGILSGRNTKTHGAFPLRGKPINVYDMSYTDVLENAEFKNLLNIIGLQLGEPVKSLSDIRFSKIVLTTDQDLDGYSIRGLLLNTFFKYWRELFRLGAIHILQTPIVKVTYKKDIISFYDLTDFEEWKSKHQNEKYESKYYKGLGTSSSKEWKEYLSPQELDKNLIQLKINSVEDEKGFELLFSKAKGMADKRKEWMGLEQK